ncbi:PIN domain-containing protein [Thermococcus barossii]|nr:PIN domain-containing protein [Thermococcus barossii]
MSRSEVFNLLPNDAIIVATCREHRIKLILTFDSDFKRVPFLKTFGEEP